ncbi:MAG: TolC family protein [Elusimicrobia bacterium]|nr:TolC family protein [Elusimicrobiota bacterium]
MKRVLCAVLAAALAAGSVCAPVRAQADSWGAPPPAEADLAQCYAWAKEQSETLRMQTEQIYQIEQQFKAAMAGVLPNLSFNASDKWLDPGSNLANPQPQVNFALSQTLFSGLREFAAMAASKHQGQAAELQLRHAYTSLYQDVANSFYLIVNLQGQLANILAAENLSESRIKELRRWVDLGKSRHSEVVLVESQEAAYEAQAAALRGQIDVARDLLSFLTGQDMSGAKLVDRLERVRGLDPEETLLARAQARYDVQALHKQVQAQEDQVRIAKGAWAPTVSFLGDYYLKRTPALDPSKWDAGVTASLPLFSGGGQLAAVRLAKSQQSQAQYNFELGLRQARSQIHSTYNTLRASVSQAVASEKAFAKANESYTLQQKEYRLGLVSNLDVLAALNSLLSAKLTFDQIVVQSELNLLLLKVSTEELP